MHCNYVFDSIHITHSCYLIEGAIELALSSGVNPEYIKSLVDEIVERKKSILVAPRSKPFEGKYHE